MADARFPHRRPLPALLPPGGTGGGGPGSVRISGGEEKWFVRYLLQAAADPSLLIPVQDAWNPGRRTAALLRPGDFNPREYLLVSLGQSARLCPIIESGLKTALPAGHSLDTHGAWAFLTEKAAVLEQAGFGVMLPAWWTRLGTKLRLTARAQVNPPRCKGAAALASSPSFILIGN